MQETIAFIGGGNMASALIGGLLRDGWSNESIFVIDRNQDQRARLKTTYGVQAYSSYSQFQGRGSVTVWAVKPQGLHEIASQISHLMAGSLHISIAAGIGRPDLCTWLGTERVVRAMPNTAALVGAGVTGLCAAAGIDDDDRLLVERIVKGTGACFWVEDDERMNAVTAVSGSGPAYAFHFMEGLQDAARSLGFDDARAKDLAMRVVEGAVRQALATDEALSTLRQRVTSKGGTTAAAIDVLDRRGTKDATIEAVRAAFARAGQLAKELKSGDASTPSGQ